MTGPGVLALVGGGEWREKCRGFDQQLLERSGGRDVLVLPTAAAYEHPDRAVAWASEHFAALGAEVTGCMVLKRWDAEEARHAEAVRAARFIYLGGGSSLHLRSVMKDSAVWDALVHAWNDGAVVAGSSAGAMVLCDPMVDPRGGALTLGLGLVEQLTVIPHANTWSPEKARRTYDLATGGLAVVGIDEQTALIRDPDGRWQAQGAGSVTVWRDGHQLSIDQL